MPHATESPDEQDRLDDQLIQQTLNSIDGGVILPEQDRELEVGDKADDAVDFADLSDDDLADDEEAGQSFEADPATQEKREVKMSGVVDEEGDFSNLNGDGTDFDDLFGEGPSSPVDGIMEDIAPFDIGDALNNSPLDKHPTLLFGVQPREDQMYMGGPRSTRDSHKKAALTKEEQEQRDLFAMSAMSSETVPQPVENAEELLATLWPKFKRNTIPYFMELVPGRRMRYQGKVPPKPPKPLQFNKLNLELAPDQEKNFRVSLGISKRMHDGFEMAGIITTGREDTTDKCDDEFLDMDSDYENDIVGGISWQDLQMACQDWEVASMTDVAEAPERDLEEKLELGLEWPPAKVKIIPLQLEL